MKYFTDSCVRDFAQKFQTSRPEYILDEDNDVLVETGIVDEYELIQSNKDCALDAILDKFLNYGVPVDNTLKHVSVKKRDLDLFELGAFLEKLNQYKVDNNLSIETTNEAVLRHMQDKADSLKNQLTKEVSKSNEKTHKNESVQTSIQSNSSQGA